jgi:Na+/proline symporter
MISALVVTLALHVAQPFSGNASVVFAKTALTTTAITTVAWLAVTLLTSPESNQVLLKFYETVRPDIRGWKPIARLAPNVPVTSDLPVNLGCWLLGCAMIYLALFGTGKFLLHEATLGLVLLAASIVCAVVLYRTIKNRWSTEPVFDGERAHAQLTH